MRTRLNFKLAKAIVKIIILVTIINLIGSLMFIIGDVLYGLGTKIDIFRKPSLFDVNAYNFTTNFRGHVVIDLDGNISLKDTGKRILDDRKSWFQLLDDNGQELYAYNTHDGVLKKYSPYKLVIRSEIAEEETLFIEEFTRDGITYSYIIGFPKTEMGRFVVAYGVEHIQRIIVLFAILSFSMYLILSSGIGFYYSKKLTLPMYNILNRIDLLSNNIYHTEYDSDPLYSDIYENLNKLSENLQQAEVEREELEKLKSDWISNISHDIKTPLASIRGYSEIMKDYELSEEEIKKYGDILNEKSIYIEELLGELRLSNRLKDKEIDLQMEEIDLVDFSKSIIVEILNTENYDVNIGFTSNKDVIKKTIDKFMFKRVFENLIYNAIYYSKEEIQIEISIEEIEGKITLQFKDNGIGIKEEDVKNIFNRYYRGSNTHKKGTGLGLAITKDIVERHEGTIEVSSKLGEWTEFKIRF